jgi:hypothetical protein
MINMHLVSYTIYDYLRNSAKSFLANSDKSSNSKRFRNLLGMMGGNLQMGMNIIKPGIWPA